MMSKWLLQPHKADDGTPATKRGRHFQWAHDCPRSFDYSDPVRPLTSLVLHRLDSQRHLLRDCPGDEASKVKTLLTACLEVPDNSVA